MYLHRQVPFAIWDTFSTLGRSIFLAAFTMSPSLNRVVKLGHAMSACKNLFVCIAQIVARMF